MDAVKHAAQKVSGKVGGSSGNGQTVLITGASGYIATHIINEFLEHGYHVRGTVRSEQKADDVRKSVTKHGDKLSFAIVKDIGASGAFDEAVKGVDGVIHTASPFQMQVNDNEKDLLIPAIQGTLSILQAVAAYNPKVKRVVITSSFASIVDIEKGPWPEHTYSEEDWNPVTYDTAKSTSNGSVSYLASKTFAEREAFKYVEENKPNFSISTICPPMVYGPVEHGVNDMSKLNTSAADIYRLMNGSEKEVPENMSFAYVDVRDVATAHRLAYEKPEAANQRYFVTEGNYSYQMFCDILRNNLPEIRDKTPQGKEGSGLGMDVYKVNNQKSKDLGVTYRSMEETVTETATSLLRLERHLVKV